MNKEAKSALKREQERLKKLKQAEKRGEYKYSALKDCKVGEDELYHFYAVIVDAQFPHKSYKTDRFICTSRVVDATQPVDHDGVVEYCTLVFFAKRFEDLPICQRIGDIIRVHRAHVQEYKGIKQFSANIFFNSSWALFSPLTPKDRLKQLDEQVDTGSKPVASADSREFHPFAYYGKTFSFDISEKKIITSQREWIAKTFAKHPVLSERYITKLKDIPEFGGKRETGRYYDFDL